MQSLYFYYSFDFDKQDKKICYYSCTFSILRALRPYQIHEFRPHAKNSVTTLIMYIFYGHDHIMIMTSKVCSVIPPQFDETVISSKISFLLMKARIKKGP